MTNEQLAELGKALRTQNNRATGHPLYVVQQKRRIYGMESGYADQWTWIDEEYGSCGTTEARELIKESEGLDCNLTAIDPADHGYTRTYYTEYWDFVTAHLTEKAATRYMNENAHNLNEPRVYVTSQYRCDEFNAVVEYLRGQ